MKFSSPATRIGKGQLRCHDCRKTILMKEGDWRDRGNQQIFLCKVCDKIDLEAQKKSASGL